MDEPVAWNSNERRKEGEGLLLLENVSMLMIDCETVVLQDLSGAGDLVSTPRYALFGVVLGTECKTKGHVLVPWINITTL